MPSIPSYIHLDPWPVMMGWYGLNQELYNSGSSIHVLLSRIEYVPQQVNNYNMTDTAIWSVTQEEIVYS